MTCYYCDRIRAADPAYAPAEAAFDLASAAPRCGRHWRYRCGRCGNPAHFMATAWCRQSRRFYCADCAAGRDEVARAYWGWTYALRYRSPWGGAWEPSLDRLEFEGGHPLDVPATRALAEAAVSAEPYLVRYPMDDAVSYRPGRAIGDDEVRRSWNENAELWVANYDDDGDRTRRYQSDEPMLELLGDVGGLRVLDVGSGNGYLCRKLARGGALMTGVELCDRFHAMAAGREVAERLGIDFHRASVTTMPFLAGASFDRAVSNFVLMDVTDYEAALGEVARVLKPGGVFVIVISHPCFACGPGGWEMPAADSPRPEERSAYRVDRYFDRGAYIGQWGNLKPVISFHRPLRDYWRAFAAAGFAVTGFEEPSVTERGRRELSPGRLRHVQRIPFSCIFRLERLTPKCP